MTAVLPPRTRNWPGIIGGLTAFFALTIATCIPTWGGIDINLGQIARNWRNGADRLAQMFTPDWSILPRTWEPLLETLAMAVVGAAISAVIALPLSLWAARPTNPSTPWRTLVRGIINVIRAVPDLVYATILVAMLGVGESVGVLCETAVNIEEAMSHDGILRMRLDLPHNKRYSPKSIDYPTPYTDVRLEPDYRRKYALECDLTFWAVQFLHLMNI